MNAAHPAEIEEILLFQAEDLLQHLIDLYQRTIGLDAQHANWEHAVEGREQRAVGVRRFAAETMGGAGRCGGAPQLRQLGAQSLHLGFERALVIGHLLFVRCLSGFVPRKRVDCAHRGPTLPQGRAAQM